jgi:hypothetical protein
MLLSKQLIEQSNNTLLSAHQRKFELAAADINNMNTIVILNNINQVKILDNNKCREIYTFNNETQKFKIS